MIDPKRELFQWGPIDGYPIYTDTFTQAFCTYPAYAGVSWPDCYGYFENGMITFVLDDERLRDRGEILFNRDIMVDTRRKEGYEKWLKTVERVRHFETKVNEGLEQHTDDELHAMYSAWEEADVRFWHAGFLPEIANWGGERILKRKLEGHEAFVELFEKLTAPDKLSFFQIEELALLKIKLASKENQERLLAEHQKKYYWLRNDYGHTRILDVQYFRDELREIEEKTARAKIAQIEGYGERIRAAREEFIKKYDVSDELVRIGACIAECVWWQDFRKQFIFIENHATAQFCYEVQRRFGIPYEDLRYYLRHEVRELLASGKKIDVSKRKEAMLEIYEEGADMTRVIEGGEAREKMAPLLAVKIVTDATEVRGIVVSKGSGTTHGKVCVMKSPRNDTMRQGQVLIAPMTSPDYILAMRKAVAIVTDQGGMTSHAAIVSRELGIPCIVGTKVATKVFKDGDRVEVNVEKGVVRKI